MKLKLKLMLTFSITVLVTAGALATLGLVQTGKQATQSVNNKLNGLVSTATYQLDGWLHGNEKLVETLGLVFQEAVPASNLNADYLSIMYKGTNPENLEDIFYGNENGDFMNGSGFEHAAGYDPRERSWYKEAVQADKLIFTDPYLDNKSKQFTVSIAMPVKTKSGALQGVVASDILLSKLTDTVNQIDLDGLGYTFMLDKKGVILAHPDTDLASTSAADNGQLAPLLVDMQSNLSGQKSFQYNGENLLLYFKQIPSTGWIVGSVISEKLAYAEFYELRNQYILIIAITLLAVLTIAYWVATRFIKPLKRLQLMSGQMSLGDFTDRVDTKGKDEFAELGAAFNTMSDHLSILLQKVKSSADQVHDISKDMENHTGNTQRIAEQIFIATDELAQGSSSQAESVYEGSNRLSAMSQTMNGINDSLEQSVMMMEEVTEAMSAGLQSVDTQVELAEDNRNSIDRVGEAIDLLADKSRKIESIASMIHNISAQTNLLALNASIEAARAGVHGNGFAVVATEVRKLAEQSSQSVEDIIVLLDEIQAASEQSVNEVTSAEKAIQQQVTSVHEMRNVFARIKQSIEGIDLQVRHVSTATAELDNNAGKISEVISSVAAMSEQSAASTEEVASSTQEQFNYITTISERSKELNQHANTLFDEIKKFKI
ncbi:Methyl-accepting chemotaxis protein McpB [Paenibacillus sp. JJ-100]|uniref:methyl-accepting chemotaxis protein n=1 Tax=Paenibacillus sp. JJ-100 TaxID=2974896 RepID=UPI0022FF62EC|nr:methyl-accepting chemotaxis protein [Paenibacillus sp. JJ-100]CAI6086521.1 Methyl-accepting chemotaxis protein McpB [Paenibacillus sp. JJ-100]